MKRTVTETTTGGPLSTTPGATRRAVVAGAAWTVPVIATAIGSPLASASTPTAEASCPADGSFGATYSAATRLQVQPSTGDLVDTISPYRPNTTGTNSLLSYSTAAPVVVTVTATMVYGGAEPTSPNLLALRFGTYRTIDGPRWTVGTPTVTASSGVVIAAGAPVLAPDGARAERFTSTLAAEPDARISSGDVITATWTATWSADSTTTWYPFGDPSVSVPGYSESSAESRFIMFLHGCDQVVGAFSQASNDADVVRFVR